MAAEDAKDGKKERRRKKRRNCILAEARGGGGGGGRAIPGASDPARRDGVVEDIDCVRKEGRG